MALLAGVVVAASQAGTASASAPIAGWSYTRINTPGLYYAVMTEVATTTCQLNKVTMAELNSPGNSARCEIKIQNGRWVLEAALNAASSGSNTADVTCSAACFAD